MGGGQSIYGAVDEDHHLELDPADPLRDTKPTKKADKSVGDVVRRPKRTAALMIIMEAMQNEQPAVPRGYSCSSPTGSELASMPSPAPDCPQPTQRAETTGQRLIQTA